MLKASKISLIYFIHHTFYLIFMNWKILKEKRIAFFNVDGLIKC